MCVAILEVWLFKDKFVSFVRAAYACCLFEAIGLPQAPQNLAFGGNKALQ
jgi:hypothetical protein